jgi:hypothetical protein
MDNQIERFLTELRSSSESINSIYLNGSCLNLYMILKVLYPTSEPYYDPIVGHIITRIDDRYYDITGRIYDVSNYLPYNPESLGWTNKKFNKSFNDMYRKSPHSS